jgi:predicted GNAT family acetyltransferase
MPFVVYENTIVYKEDGKVLAEVAYPPIGIGVVDICRTHVDESLRGQGMAAQLMERTVKELRKTCRKAVPTCSYAVKWFEEHADYADILDKKSN